LESDLTAINHWPIAIATHTLNHPGARHLCASLDALNPRELYNPGVLDLLWASPECTHHSVARGGKPINDQSRATAWCVVRWAEALMPPVILIENVPEFIAWGGIGSDGRPMKSKKGATFAAWVGALESLGYKVGWKKLRAADYGDPTTRQRLFIQAVRGKRRVVWPNATHAAPGGTDLFEQNRRPWRTAGSDVIDWKIKGESIYSRKRPLSKNTMRRIMDGLKKFGGNDPFIVEMRGTSDSQISRTAHSINGPLGTVSTSGAHHALINPFLIAMEHGGSVRSINDPINTITTAKGGAHALIEPCLLPQQSCGALRPVSQPAPTVSTAGAIALIEPFLVEYYGTAGAESVNQPLNTVTCKDRHALVQPEVRIDGKRYVLDILFRMLQPHELAAAQGFPSGYQFSGTKTDAVKQIGNAVPRRLARAIVLAVMGQNSDIQSYFAPAKAA
jgi:DNA (cytosine-5)-methyltransferase 1